MRVALRLVSQKMECPIRGVSAFHRDGIGVESVGADILRPACAPVDAFDHAGRRIGIVDIAEGVEDIPRAPARAVEEFRTEKPLRDGSAGDEGRSRYGLYGSIGKERCHSDTP